MILADTLMPLAGGVVIGAAAGGFRIMTGRIAGISGIYRQAITGPDRWWRLAFLAGLVMAGVGATALGAMRGAAAIDAMGLPLLIGGGLLVGFGAGFGGGCTSGHGVCGIARLSPRSLVAVPVFMLSAILTVLVTK